VITYRKLPKEEWGRLKPLFEFLDQFLPDSVAAECGIAELENGAIVGFQMAQLVIHMEPHWQSPQYRGIINPIRLHNLVIPKDVSKSLCAPGVMAIASDENVEGLLKVAGYTQMPGTIWIKDLRKKEEAA